VRNIDRIYPSVNSSVTVAATANADRYIPSVKPSVIIFKYVFLKLFRIHNIKLYKLMVIKTNYANKIFIKHQKQKNKVK